MTYNAGDRVWVNADRILMMDYELPSGYMNTATYIKADVVRKRGKEEGFADRDTLYVVQFQFPEGRVRAATVTQHSITGKVNETN